MKMKKKLIIIVFFCIIIISTIFAVYYFYVRPKIEKENTNTIEISQNTNANDKKEKIIVNEDLMVIGIENKNEPKEPNKEEEKKEEQQNNPTLDAATLTSSIYNLNIEIGTLYIPKTGLTTPVYCNSSVYKMEEMPCFLYTTGGLNKPGATLIVGHNRRNGKMFSNNKKIQEGDEFYFKDYEGKELKYIVYSTFITTEDDMSFLEEGETSPVIALSCCTDANDENRIIVMGRAEN